ncbi:MAG: 3-hydroxylacyl-ACP dehydratase [Pseudomonadota bacterium]
MLDRRWIEAHIPHKGNMCLLDAVLEWDAERIVCRSATHRLPDNPLRAAGSLASVCGIEYAAQAIAVHGAIVAAPYRTASAAGYLASVRNVHLHVATLDDVRADLTIRGQRLAGDDRSVLYEFTVADGEQLLLGGRASIVLDIAVGAPR